METEYIIAGSVYVASALGCILVLMRMTRSFPRFLRNLIIGAGAVLLLTPWFVDQEFQYYAPAFVVFMMDTLFEDTGMAPRAGKAMILSGLVAFLVVVVVEIVARRRSRNRENLFL
ncbi:MAG: hypothetical protein OEZ23_01790 [Gammaproteobacteria bacterium]|nr:hypothetical protein [Gammaproteobacteria bacterium]